MSGRRSFRGKILGLAPLLVVLAVVAATTAAGIDEFAQVRVKSAAARSALSAYDQGVKHARDEYDRKIEIAAGSALHALEDAKKSAMRNSDLDEANAINEAIVRVRDGSAQLQSQATIPPEGIWHIKYMNGGSRDVRFFPNGTVAWQENGHSQPTTPKVQKVNGDYLLQFTPDKVDRITIVGDRLYDECFSPTTDFPLKTPWTMGVGTK